VKRENEAHRIRSEEAKKLFNVIVESTDEKLETVLNPLATGTPR